MSVMDCSHFGSSMSIRGFFTSGKAVSLRAKMELSNPLNYVSGTQNAMSFYANNVRALSIHAIAGVAGGTMHGTWNSDIWISTSDRSLKTNIRNLDQTLLDGKTADPLAELRPVSYNYKGDEAKGLPLRFGFIADEVSKVLPQVVRTLPQGEDKQGLVYQDLLAFLVAALQGLTKEMAVLMPQLASIEGRIAQRKRWKRARRRKAAAAAAVATGSPQRRGGIASVMV